MKKEVFIVIIIGVFIGITVAFGIYTAQKALENQKQSLEKKDNIENIVDQTTKQENHFLIVEEPLDESVHSSETITVSGQTSPEAVITIITQENELLFTADQDGNFSAQISLVGGANQITISSFNQLGEKEEVSLTVVYSTADL